MRAPLLGLAKSIYYFITRTSSAANSMYILYTHQWWYLWFKRIKKKKNHSEQELFKKSIGWLAVLIYYHWVPFSTGSSRLKRPSVTPKRELAIFSLTIIDQC